MLSLKSEQTPRYAEASVRLLQKGALFVRFLTSPVKFVKALVTHYHCGAKGSLNQAMNGSEVLKERRKTHEVGRPRATQLLLPFPPCQTWLTQAQLGPFVVFASTLAKSPHGARRWFKGSPKT